MNILIAGDYAPRYRLAESVESGNFQEIFPEEVREIIRLSDFSLVNFESPIAESDFVPIPKCGPNLHCSPLAADSIKYAGFTGVTLANNHILDFGENGLRKTVECCRNDALDIVGVGENLWDAATVLYLEHKCKRLAVINCCEHEFSIATDTQAGANPLNPVRQWYQIQNAKTNADYVIVIVHGGHEYFQLPSLRMQDTYRFFIDAGADAVVNHHQHCYSGYEIYNGKPIFYGLGNFCFDEDSERDSSWNEGFILDLNFNEDEINYELISYIQCSESVGVRLMDEKQKQSFKIKIQELNSIISDRVKLQAAQNEYYCTNYTRQVFMFEPYQNKVLDKLFDMKILPSTISKSRMLSIMNHIMCESHRDKLLKSMSLITEKYVK